MMQSMNKAVLSNSKQLAMKYINGSSCYAAAILVTASFPVSTSSFATNACTKSFFSRCSGYGSRNHEILSSGGVISSYPPTISSKSSRNLILSSFSSKGGDGYGNGMDESASPPPVRFRRGNPIQVEVTRFGPLGASVEVIAKSHNEHDLIPPDEPPLAYGLILQSEIGYYRAARGGLDVVVGEILPAYVNWVRDDGKVDITIRKPGGKGKAEDLSKAVLEKIQQSPDGELQVGDKSSPQDINRSFPGASKAQFKRAVALLYKKGLVRPGAHSTKLM